MSDRPLVLDASAFLSGKPIPREGVLLVPYAVLQEVEKRGRDQRSLEYALATGLSAREPSAEARARAREAATRTGDVRRLSAPDLDVLALALDVGGEVASDDYSIQNVAAAMSLPYRGITQAGIREVFRWRLRCIGCRKVFEGDVPECDVCGSPVKTVRARD